LENCQGRKKNGVVELKEGEAGLHKKVIPGQVWLCAFKIDDFDFFG
jgi:hypothetical protein